MRIVNIINFIFVWALSGALTCNAQLLYNQSNNGLYLQSGADLYVEGGVEISNGGSGDAYFSNSGNVYVAYDQSNFFVSLAGRNWTNNNSVNDGMINDLIGSVYMFNGDGFNEADNALIDGTSQESRFNRLVLGGLDPNNGNAPVYTSLRTIEQRLNVIVDETLDLNNNEHDLTSYTIRLTDNADILNATSPSEGDELEGAGFGFFNDFGWINTHENTAFVIRETRGSGPATPPYLFPVGSDDVSQSGDIHYFPVEINSSTPIFAVRLDNHNARNELGGSHILTGTIKDVEAEFYHQVYAEEGNTNANVTFYVDYRNNALSANCLDPANNFNYGRYNGVGWFEENYAYVVAHSGSPGDLQGYTINNLLVRPLASGNIHFTLVTKESAPDDCFLPVEMIYLEANPIHNNYIEVRWATAAELNSDLFEVQRSLDGIHYETLGWVPAAGHSNEYLEYSFNDHNVVKGTMYYYRLKQIDFDQSYEFTEVVTARLAPDQLAWSSNIFPNPILEKDPIVTIYAPENAMVKLLVHAMNGQLMYEKVHHLNTGNNHITLPFNQWARSTYEVSLIHEDFVRSTKLVKLY